MSASDDTTTQVSVTSIAHEKPGFLLSPDRQIFKDRLSWVAWEPGNLSIARYALYLTRLLTHLASKNTSALPPTRILR